MSKPIVLTEDLLQEWLKEFETKARNTKMSEGKFTYTQEIEYEGDDKVKVIFTPSAYIKMLTLLREFSDEVAWHGVVDRQGDDAFVISDILVYPQKVTGSTVNTDQEEYTKWMTSIPNEVFNRMHMQGHSHVNMQVTPSSVDLNHQEAIISQLHGDHFYIFMIWNKRLEHNIKVYDFRENTLYEDKDCIVSIATSGLDAEKFIQGAKDQVRRSTPAAVHGAGAYGSGAYGQAWNRGDYYNSGYSHSGAYGEVRSAVSGKQEQKKEKKAAKKKDAKSASKADKDSAQDVSQYKLPAPVSAAGNRGKILDNITDYDKFIYGTAR